MRSGLLLPLFTEARGRSIVRSSYVRCSRNFACTEFSEVRMYGVEVGRLGPTTRTAARVAVATPMAPATTTSTPIPSWT
jgi:hypothetical protein